MKKFLFSLLLIIFTITKVNAMEDLAPNSESAILLEVSTKKVIYEKNSNEKLAPASMTKVMSMLLIMEAIDSGKVSYEDEVVISDKASGMGGSQIFLQVGEKYKVKDLLKGIAVASGNDAVIAMAEKIGGTVENFVKMMNDKASSLGLTNTHFDNPHGLSSENHYTTASDMSKMALELLKHPDILKFTSIYEDYLTKNDGSSIWLVNTNKLVRFYEGVDGLKTGFTDEAGYCITTTAKKGDIRFLSVVMKAPTSDLRSKDTVNMLNYGFNSYKLKTLFKKEEDLGNAEIIKGKKEKVSVHLKDNVTILNGVNEEEQDYNYELKIEKIKPPIKKSDKVGVMEIKDKDGNVVREEDIIVDEDIEKAGFFDLFKRVVKLFMSGKYI